MVWALVSLAVMWALMLALTFLILVRMEGRIADLERAVKVLIKRAIDEDARISTFLKLNPNKRPGQA